VLFDAVVDVQRLIVIACSKIRCNVIEIIVGRPLPNPSPVVQGDLTPNPSPVERGQGALLSS